MLESIKNNFNELLERTGAITENGSSYFKGLLGKINVFSSSEALVIEHQLCDETHYFLVPDRDSDSDYSLFTKRVLPEGYSTDNELPKRRIFQLPHQASIESLEKLLHQDLQSSHLKKLDASSPLAERLDSIAQEIDEKSNHITNGLLIIGGVVAIANPLLGVGIAAKALLPSLTSTATTSGLDQLSNIFKSKKKQANEKEANKAASREVKSIKKLTPEIKINPALELLHKSLHTSDPDYDPLIESFDLWSDLSESRHLLIASEAITTVYAERIKKNTSSHLHANDIAWLNSLKKI